MKNHLKLRTEGGNWYANKKYKGEVLRDCTGTADRPLAEQRLIEMQILIDRGEWKPFKKTFVKCSQEWIAQLDMKIPNQKRMEIIVRVHLVPRFGQCRIIEIIRHDSVTGKSLLTDYLKEISGWPMESVKKIRRCLKHIIRKGDHAFEMPAPEFCNAGFFQTRFLTTEELEAIIGCLDDQHQAVALVMAYTGMDRGDVINLRWGNVDFKNSVIRVPRKKIKRIPESRMMDIPIIGRVMDVLKYRSRVRHIHDDRIFKVTGNAFLKAWNRAKKKAEVDWGEGVRCSPKDLRHFFISHLLNKGVEPLMIAELVGHTDLNMMRKRYGHFTPESKAKAMELFDLEGSQI